MLNLVRYVKKKHEKALLAKRNIVGCGIGYKEVGGVKTDELCIIVSVVKKFPRAYVRPEDLIPLELNGIKTDVRETGTIWALKERIEKWRPAPGGVSIGHPAITAGSTGCLVQRDGEPFILSNNHVMAASNQAEIGDPILQPGPHDGGVMPDDQIGTLEDFVEVKFLLDQLPDCPVAVGAEYFVNWLAWMSGSKHRVRAYQDDPLGMNLVDAAIARPLQPDFVTAEILELGFPTGTVVGELGMGVQKSGRTTGLTVGNITVVDLTIQVMYGTNIALFTDQLQGDLTCGGGDSGSAVLDPDKRVVGLLFAGSEDGSITIFNRFENVASELGLDGVLPSV